MQPNLGVLAAECVRQIAAYIQAYVNKSPPPAIVVAPLSNVEAPPLRLFKYVEITDDIKPFTVTKPEDDEVTGSPQKRVATKARGSTWVTPQKKKPRKSNLGEPEAEGKLVVSGGEDTENDANEDANADEENVDIDDIGNVLDDIDAEEIKAKPKPKGKGAVKPKGKPNKA